MSLFIETICYRNGIFERLPYHQDRLNYTMGQFFHNMVKPELSVVLNSVMQDEKMQQRVFIPGEKYKCRIVYGETIKEVSCLQYRKRNITKLILKEAGDLDYSYKFYNRRSLDNLRSTLKSNSEILLIQNGLIKDTSFSNVIFYNGKQWLTPSQPLLKGTMRQYLLEKEQIYEADIRPEDLRYFSKLRLINAMNSFEEAQEFSILQVKRLEKP